MKHSKRHDNDRTAIHPLVPVHFEFTHPTATTVAVAGSFNNWMPEAKALHASGGGLWLKETALLPGTYEYCFVVDGHWIDDPLAKETVPNPYGGRNSLLRVVRLTETTHRHDAETLPLSKTRKPTASLTRPH